MTVSKLNPWNWFKKESEQEKTLPVKQTEREARAYASPLDQFHTEFDRMVDSMFSGFGLPSPRRMFDMAEPRLGKSVIKPKVDVYGTDKEYVIEADLPGIEEKDLSVELKDNVLILSAEKKHEEKTEDKGYYRVERSYGSFRRVLNVPEDADRDNINAKLKKGVLCITMPRTKTIASNSRKIAIDSSAST
ncbi:Hsp20/alpha crystallin family protein [Pseudodesulfovibrio sp. zrk46]|uniref:Hsp20/alpha crystallin family protein n=1 Tax=Pseudodesulfovibrio sp. zrk46 TaxID=2725288 RepID=UPI00144985CC|nr:Hsp20/alpha crystallin family protein [Pseudodesulfovibrio sp. zrk46]QJB58237.1 Hsp20/alpha crystallin family protein [Pseudodesulfovibrio sp. zrk46]